MITQKEATRYRDEKDLRESFARVQQKGGKKSDLVGNFQALLFWLILYFILLVRSIYFDLQVYKLSLLQVPKEVNKIISTEKLSKFESVQLKFAFNILGRKNEPNTLHPNS